MSKMINFRVTEDEHRRYTVAMQLAHTDMTTYLRQCCERLVGLVSDTLPPGVTLDDVANMDIDASDAIDKEGR